MNLIHEYEFKIYPNTYYFTSESRIEIYDEDDEKIATLDPEDLKVISAVYDTLIDEWDRWDKQDKERYNE